MATYIQGVQGYIPQIQPFQPDLNFYKGVMDVKESQYKAGYDKVSNMYGQLLNSELTRGVNNERRSKFFDQITNDIQKMAGVDLSLEQNVDAAYQIFQPLIDDKNVIKDMAWTKNFNREFQRSESFRNCTDEKKCGGKWWEDGVRAMNYQRMDFAKATDDQALGFTNVKYTPYVNVTEKATKLAKEMGFNVQSVTWSPDGRYIVTTKNGPAMTVSLTNYFNSVFGNDPQVQELYKTKAYLQRKDYAYGNAEQYGSEDAAEQAYLTETMNYIEQQQNQLKQEAEDEADQLQLKTNIVEKKQANGEVDLDNPDDELARAYEQLRNETGVINSVLDQHTNTLSLIDKSTLLGADLETMRWRVDQAVAGSLLNQELYTAADSYAMLNMEQKIEADPYAKASFENSLAMGRMYAKHELDMQMVEYKAAMGLVEDEYGNVKKGSGKGNKRDYLSGRSGNILHQESNPWGNNNATDYKPVKGLAGANAEKNLYEADAQEANTYAQGTDQISARYLGDMYQELTGIMRSKPGSDEAKLAENTLTEIIGKDNIKFAMDNGILDKNLNILDNYQFSQFIQNNRDNLMNSANKGFTENFKFLYNMNNENDLAKITAFQDNKVAYDQLSQLSKIYEDRNKQFATEVKTTFLSKPTEDKSNSWLTKAGRFFEDYGAFIPGASGVGLLAKGFGYLKDKITGDKSHLVDYANNQVQNIIAGPSQKNREMFINQMFEKDGYTFKSKDQFIADSFNAYKQNTGWLKTKTDTYGNESPLQRALTSIVPLRNQIDFLQVNDNEINNYLGKVYDTMASQYKKEYSSGRLGSYNQGTHTYADASEIMVDGADMNGEGIYDFISIMNNFDQVQDEEGVKILRGAGLTDKDFLDANKQDKVALDLYHYLYNDMLNVSYNYNDKERPIVRMVNQKIAANDPNMTAYTFQVNKDYLIANKGTDKKPGGLSSLFKGDELKKDADTFTIYIPKDKANNDYIAKVETGPWQTLYDQTGMVDVKMTNVGNVQIKRQGNTTIAATNYDYFNINTGKYESLVSNETVLNEGADLDSWLRQLYNNQYYTKLLYTNLANEIEYKNRKKQHAGRS